MTVFGKRQKSSVNVAVECRKVIGVIVQMKEQNLF
jgi:hypothetical protein